MNKPKLTIAVITRNEESMIKDCLESALFADELVVVDSGSTDMTLNIVKEFGAKIFKRSFVDFSDLRNYVQTKVTGDWLLYIDADERISKKLEEEITKTIMFPKEFNAFSLPRLNIFFGCPMYHGNWYPDYQTKLFRKDKLMHWTGAVHESPKVNGQIGILKNNLIHLSRSIKAGFSKSSAWTKIEADLICRQGNKPIKIRQIIKLMSGEYFRRIIANKGILDGNAGLLEGIIQSFNKFLVYAQAWEKQQ